jgi:hypothetical protein
VERHVDDRLAEMLRRSQSVKEGETRLLFQHLHVEYVAIQEVCYRYRNSPVKSLWIYGTDQRIHAPAVPRPWFKFAAVALGCVLLAAAVLALLSGWH